MDLKSKQEFVEHILQLKIFLVSRIYSSFKYFQSLNGRFQSIKYQRRIAKIKINEFNKGIYNKNRKIKQGRCPIKLITLIILFKPYTTTIICQATRIMIADSYQPPSDQVKKAEGSSIINNLDMCLDNKKLCRICLSSEKEGDNQLIVPCKCSGSLLYVHKTCYYQWIRHRYDRLQSEEQKSKMEHQGFDCEICKTAIKVQFEFRRSLVNKEEFGKICKNSIPLTITIIVFFMIATAAFSYLVYFADLTKEQFEKSNISQAVFTVVGIIVVILFFGAGMFFFVTKYLWVEKMEIVCLKNDQRII